MENISNGNQTSKTIHNEVAVQINYGKDSTKKSNKKLVTMLCILSSVVVVCLCVLRYVVFGIVLQKDSYLVKFDTQGGTNLTDLVVKEGEKIEALSTPLKEGYTFDGWYVGDKKWDFNIDKIKGNTTLTARWTPNENTVTYVDYESGQRFESKGKTDENVVLLSNTFTKAGYTFSGWALSPNGDIVYTNCATIKMGAENITLYAVWKTDEYTLTLNCGNGKINDTYPDKFTVNDKITLPIPSLDDHTFDGWYDENGKKYNAIDKGTANDVILNARYTPIEYEIDYVLNGGVEFTYYLSTGYGNTITITGCTGKGQVAVPSTIDGYEVKTISANAFSGQYEITEIIIPSSVDIIDVTAFEECTALEKITYLGTNTEFRSQDGVLYGDNGRSIVKYPEGKQDAEFTVPLQVDIIRAFAFKNNTYLTKITLPSDVENDNYVGKLEEGAFEGCVSLETVEGCAIEYFDKEAFKDCHNLKELTFLAPEISFIMNQVFLNCSSLESITFKGKVGVINWQSFGFCTNLKNVTFESTLEKLGWGCFEECISLESITIPEGTTVIGGEAFKDCTVLENVTISSTVATIEENAFSGTSIKKIFIPSTVTKISEYAFEGIENVIIYCEASSKPDEWNENWNAISSTEKLGCYEVKWSQTGIPNEE